MLHRRPSNPIALSESSRTFGNGRGPLPPAHRPERPGVDVVLRREPQKWNILFHLIR